MTYPLEISWEATRNMIPDPQRTARVYTYVTKAIWLAMAWAFGSMVGQLLLHARAALTL